MMREGASNELARTRRLYKCMIVSSLTTLNGASARVLSFVPSSNIYSV